LRTLLERAGLKETAAEILFKGADRGRPQGAKPSQFLRSLPLDKALDASTLVAWEMNGAPIPAKFGGPIRLIVPGWYGMASVKWLERVEALERPYSGYFQTDHYIYAPGEQVTVMRVKSIFTEPVMSTILRRTPLILRGMAWGGQGGVARVEISTGCTDHDWREARLVGPALPHAWRQFEVAWTPPARGRYVLRCRAASVAGEVQPDAPEWNPLGYAANGVQRLAVTIV
jgi:DMSO/TMAO reductase YedYZ molybdopterin-dependent catalytic subunit